MGAKSFLRGHVIEYINNIWCYADTKESTVNNERPCGKCGMENTIEDHDYCLGTIRSVMNACCGHGNTKEAYVQFNKSTKLSELDAVKWIESYKILERRLTN